MNKEGCRDGQPSFGYERGVNYFTSNDPVS